MRYVSLCTANRRVINDDMRLSMLSVGSRRNSGNEYPDDRTRDGERSTTKTCCDVVVAWSADDSWLTTRAVRTARNVRCTVHMQRVAMTQPRAKNSLTSIWRPSIPAAGLQLDQRIRQHGHGVEVQLTSQLCSEIHRCKNTSTAEKYDRECM